MKDTVEWIKTGKVESMHPRYAKVLVGLGYCRQMGGPDAQPDSSGDKPARRTRGKYQRRDMTAATDAAPALIPEPSPAPAPAHVVETEVPPVSTPDDDEV